MRIRRGDIRAWAIRCGAHAGGETGLWSDHGASVHAGGTLGDVNRSAGGHPVAKPYVRLTQPLVRDTKGGELRPATWDEALDRTVAGFLAAKAAHGPTTFGTFSCSKATNEVNFAAQKFSRTVLGSNNIDSCNRT
jgi:formate dehydrogenase (hydrogenase)